MRIADETITRNYLSNLSSQTEQLAAATTKMSTGRSYQKASEDPAAAIEAMKIRSTLSKINTYQNNIDEINGITKERETALSEINDILTEAKTKLLQGQSGTYSTGDRIAIAESMNSFKNTILSLSNQKYSDKYVFGGSDEYEIPFSTDSSGNLLYHGVNVDTGTFSSESLYCDIGLGIEGSSAYNYSYSGRDLLGSGTDSNGITNNIYNVLGDIADMFSNNDLTNLSAYSDKLDEVSDNVLVQYTTIGEDSSYISTFTDRLTASESNATERQTKLEGADTAESSIEYNQEETAFEATLKVGAQLIQQSLLDYLR